MNSLRTTITSDQMESRLRSVETEADLTNVCYDEVDNHVRSDNIEQLVTITDIVNYLTVPFESIELKARAIFVWIAENIGYDLESFLSNTNEPYDESLDAQFSDQEKEIYNSVARSVFVKRRGVCAGFSRLFKSMCEQAGFGDKCHCVPGFAKGFGFDPAQSFDVNTSNHEWNVLETPDGKFNLVDCTWAAGVVDGKVFEKTFNGRYFFMSPNEMIVGHFPRDEKWQLLSTPLSANEFKHRVLMGTRAFQFGLRTISHPHSKISLTESNITKIILGFKEELQWEARLEDLESGDFVESDCTKCETSSEEGIVTITVCIPNKERDFKLHIFAGIDSVLEQVISYVMRVEESASMEELSFPGEYQEWIDYEGVLHSPSTGKLNIGETYHFKIQFPVSNNIEIVEIEPNTKLNNMGEGIFEGDYTASEEGTISVFAGQRTNLDGMIYFQVA